MCVFSLFCVSCLLCRCLFLLLQLLIHAVNRSDSSLFQNFFNLIFQVVLKDCMVHRLFDKHCLVDVLRNRGFLGEFHRLSLLEEVLLHSLHHLFRVGAGRENHGDRLGRRFAKIYDSFSRLQFLSHELLITFYSITLHLLSALLLVYFGHLCCVSLLVGRLVWSSDLLEAVTGQQF